MMTFIIQLRLIKDTYIDADCYTHDGFAELTFSVTEVHNMTPEEL